MYYRCIRFNTNQQIFKLGSQFKRSKKDLSVLWSGAPDCPVCHRTVFGAPSPYRVKPATLAKTHTRFAIIHQTVWCAIGLSSGPAG
jgi:hypothetical protein